MSSQWQRARRTLVVVERGTGALSGEQWAQQPVVDVHDECGVLAVNDDVTEVEVSASAGVELSGRTAVRVSGGRAVFTDLRMSGPAGTYLLRFSASGLPSVTAALSLSVRPIH